MSVFNVGDLVIGTRSSHGVATEKVLCIVREYRRWSDIMRVEIVGGARYYSSIYYNVYKRQFDLCSVEEYLAKYPNAIIDHAKITGDTPEEGNVIYHMDMSQKYTITDEERESLVTELCNKFKEYKVAHTKEAVEKIIDTWVQEKGWIIELFKKHPNYNGKYQIVFSQDYQRKFDRNEVDNFCRWIENNRGSVLKNHEVKTTAFSYPEAVAMRKRVGDQRDFLKCIQNEWGYKNNTINGKTIDELQSDYSYFNKIIKIYSDKEMKGELCMIGTKPYSPEAAKVYYNLQALRLAMSNYKQSAITQEQADDLNKLFNLKLAAGTKLSRAINKIMTYTGMADLPEYNAKFSKYSDAVNPVAIKRHTILSVHPIDFITMSNGNSWSSCHSVKNKGQYHSGTLSYMLDRSSFVYYTVDAKYSGAEFENQNKITRSMFHMGNEKLVQGRLYPQSTDGDNDSYFEVRNIVRRVLAQAMGIADEWTIKKGCSSCDSLIVTKGTHYPDYRHVPNCTVSHIKRKDGFKSKNKITVGHYPICPKCGREHTRNSALNCGYCN